MPSNAEYEQRIQVADNAELQRMLAAIEQGRTVDGWDAGKALEYLVLRQFQIEGARVVWPFHVKLDDEVVEQIDGAVYHGGIASLIECKDHAEPINVEPFAKIRNQLNRRPPGTMGMIFSRSGYTPSAKTLARYMSPLSVLMWEFGELAFAVREQKICAGMMTKYQFAVEKGLPDYNIEGRMR